MERITSRKNPVYVHMRRLAQEGAYREEQGAFVCAGGKLLDEAVRRGARVRIAALAPAFPDGETAGHCERVVEMPAELLGAMVQMKSAPDAVFVCDLPQSAPLPQSGRHLLLEDLQDPGNVGTILRTANAFGVRSVLLAGACADPFSPRAARATMGAIFSLPLRRVERLEELALPLYATALSPRAQDIRRAVLPDDCILAVGNEGHGLSEGLLARAAGELIIPMLGGCESLNAATAAAVVLWELMRR